MKWFSVFRNPSKRYTGNQKTPPYRRERKLSLPLIRLGWHLGDGMTAETVEKSINKALYKAQSANGEVTVSDR